MQRWARKVAVVTGAGAGMGAAICRTLLAAGMTVVGLEQNRQRLEAMRADDGAAGLVALPCDVTDEAEVACVFERIAAEVGDMHVLVNNAGMIRYGSVTGADSNLADLKSTVQTNLWGPIACTHYAVQAMRCSNVVGAHVVLINSVAGHKIPTLAPDAGPMQLNVYPSTKYGVTALAEVLRMEFNAEGREFRVTSISPGVVRTEITSADVFDQLKFVLDPVDVANAVQFALAAPPHVQITELTIQPVGERLEQLKRRKAESMDRNMFALGLGELQQDIEARVGKTVEDFEIDALCWQFVAEFVRGYGVKKSLAEAALKTYAERMEERRRLFDGLQKAHGVS